MKPPNTSHDPEQSPLPPDIVEALADALATALIRDFEDDRAAREPVEGENHE